MTRKGIICKCKGTTGLRLLSDTGHIMFSVCSKCGLAKGRQTPRLFAFRCKLCTVPSTKPIERLICRGCHREVMEELGREDKWKGWLWLKRTVLQLDLEPGPIYNLRPLADHAIVRNYLTGSPIHDIPLDGGRDSFITHPTFKVRIQAIPSLKE